jgi:hypothetical protein
VFEKDVIGPLGLQGHGRKLEQEKEKKKKEMREANKSKRWRYVNVVYEHHAPIFSNFSKLISKNFDGTLEEWVKGR